MANTQECNGGRTADLVKQRNEPQPLHALQIEDALLKLNTVRGATGLSASSIYRFEKTGELVPIRLSKRCTRWPAAAVRAFIASKTGVTEKA